ncbi:MAG: YHS domain-containing protein [Planctomycetales bacterium]
MRLWPDKSMLSVLSAGWLLWVCTLGFTADDPDTAPKSTRPPLSSAARAASIEALEEFNALVGQWRGVGRPKRNSAVDGWFEKGEWIWEIKKEQVGLRYSVKDGKQVESGLLTFDPEKKMYHFDCTLADGSRRQYAGALERNRLVLLSEAKQDAPQHQLEIKLLSDKRTVLLYQSRQKPQQQFTLVAEVGYTREGTRLAEEGAGGPECIVTGGKGTSSTVYKGKTYWFCCSGCRDAFQDDPEGIIAAAAERAAKKKAP